VVELSRVEAESAIATGYAELYVEPAPVVEEPKPAKPARAPEKFEKKPAKR
jgi:hypothetical protein